MLESCSFFQILWTVNYRYLCLRKVHLIWKGGAWRYWGGLPEFLDTRKGLGGHRKFVYFKTIRRLGGSWKIEPLARGASKISSSSSPLIILDELSLISYRWSVWEKALRFTVQRPPHKTIVKTEFVRDLTNHVLAVWMLPIGTNRTLQAIIPPMYAFRMVS